MRRYNLATYRSRIENGVRPEPTVAPEIRRGPVAGSPPGGPTRHRFRSNVPIRRRGYIHQGSSSFFRNIRAYARMTHMTRTRFVAHSANFTGTRPAAACFDNEVHRRK